MWHKYVTRRLAVQVAQAWNFGWGRAMKKVYGLSVENTLVFRDDKKTEYYMDEAQYQKYVSGLCRLLKDRAFIKNFHKQAQLKLEEILRETKRQFKEDFSKLTNKELLAMYAGFVLPNLEQFYIRMWTVFNINEPLITVVRENLAKHLKNEAEIDSVLLNLSSPLVSNDVLNERKNILRLAILKKKLSQRRFNVLLRKHTEKYKHIPMFDFDHQPYSYEYFFNEINKVKRPEREWKKLSDLFFNRRKEFKKVLGIIKPDYKFRSLLDFLKENVFLRDYRDMIRQKYNLQLQKFYKTIGGRLGLSVSEIATLTDGEIILHLKANKVFPQLEVKRRRSAFLLIQKGTKVEIYSGEIARKKATKELKHDKIGDIKLIHGVTGSKGKASGRAVVVYTNKDLRKVKDGSIMVAAMTRQDFVPAMRKAVAIVTDEGSVICHAAIIARELNIPCIVGAKIATKVFHDGDFVEVDANKGIVRKR